MAGEGVRVSTLTAADPYLICYYYVLLPACAEREAKSALSKPRPTRNPITMFICPPVCVGVFGQALTYQKPYIYDLLPAEHTHTNNAASGED